MLTQTLDVAIVGAGPYGLSVAAYAQAEGLDVRVFGRPMKAWNQHMPVGMMLKSEPAASHLADPARAYTLEAYCARHGLEYAYGSPVPVQRFVEYGRWFQDNAARDVTVDAEVTEVGSEGGDFVLTLSTHERVRARVVVLALGFLPFARVPASLAGLPASVLAHSCQVNDLSGYAGQRVAVIGAGQSALETACLLQEAGAQPQVLARCKELRWNTVPVVERGLLSRVLAPESGLGTGWRSWVWAEAPGLVPFLPSSYRRHIVRTTLGPAGSWWLRERLESVDVRLRTKLVHAARRGGGVELTVKSRGHKETIEADAVIAATGYTVDVRRLKVLEPGLRAAVRHASWAPMLTREFESTVPGLFMVGLAAAHTFGPVMRFVHGARYAARTITPALVRSARERGRGGLLPAQVALSGTNDH
ncbi:NAD(P)-binding domain-containing protein [Nonomuraea sp. NPDC050536]|uniref:NAD(P)-binding domain-containing protein n=1 Tax=Nonomuraea sp. NPDC050536 TaxID=3364366 RepID=UPI0037CBDA35